MKGTLIFDVETHSADLLYTLPPETMCRLMGYKWAGQDHAHITTDLDELRDVILSARRIIGHVITPFDLRAVFGTDSDIPLRLADEGRVVDTWVVAPLLNPAPYRYTNRHGQDRLADTPDKLKTWFSLDEQAHQLGVGGKTADLKALAREFGDPALKGKDRERDGYGKIPTDDARYVDYLKGDVWASENVCKALLRKAGGRWSRYHMREQRKAARIAVVSSNGFRVDIPNATARRDKLAARRDEIMSWLVDNYDFPTEGKAPWSTDEGKAAILKALADKGVTYKSRPDWPLTKTGQLSMGGDALKQVTAGTDAEELGEALAELKGQRSLSQLTLDSLHPDGFVHPEIHMLQRSGRTSTTDPGLTVWTARGPGAVEKEYYLPDSDDEVLISFDLSNADARAVAALSGDRNYAKRFEPGADGHMINAWAAWGRETVGEDRSDPTTEWYRQRAKVPGHGWGYKIGARTLSKQTGMPIDEAKLFIDNMNKEFRGVAKWQEREFKQACAKGFVVNPWGRVMFTEKGREFTQAPALQGQSATTEIMFDALLSMRVEVLRKVKALVHDELIVSVPRATWSKWRDYIESCMSSSMNPPGGQRIVFPASAGEPAENWFGATHE